MHQFTHIAETCLTPLCFRAETVRRQPTHSPSPPSQGHQHLHVRLLRSRALPMHRLDVWLPQLTLIRIAVRCNLGTFHRRVVPRRPGHPAALIRASGPYNLVWREGFRFPRRGDQSEDDRSQRVLKSTKPSQAAALTSAMLRSAFPPTTTRPPNTIPLILPLFPPSSLPRHHAFIIRIIVCFQPYWAVCGTSLVGSIHVCEGHTSSTSELYRMPQAPDELRQGFSDPYCCLVSGFFVEAHHPWSLFSPAVSSRRLKISDVQTYRCSWDFLLPT